MKFIMPKYKMVGAIHTSSIELTEEILKERTDLIKVRFMVKGTILDNEE